MDLREYLFRKGLSRIAFAKKVGVAANTIVMIANGKKIPSLLLAKVIQMETDGAVTVEELMSGKLKSLDTDD